MKHKFFAYALVVTFISTIASWGSMVNASSSSSGYGGSSWSSHSRGGYSGGYTGGGGHK